MQPDPTLFALLAGSYLRLAGKPLIPPGRGEEWLYFDAPFAVVAHDAGSDPRFIYANRTAQRCFEYAWEEFVGLPSRLSARAPERSERQRLLDAVRRDGIFTEYRGLRVAKSGRRFWIEGGVVWQLIDAQGVLRGQAALFASWRDA